MISPDKLRQYTDGELPPELLAEYPVAEKYKISLKWNFVFAGLIIVGLLLSSLEIVTGAFVAIALILLREVFAVDLKWVILSVTLITIGVVFFSQLLIQIISLVIVIAIMQGVIVISMWIIPTRKNKCV